MTIVTSVTKQFVIQADPMTLDPCECCASETRQDSPEKAYLLATALVLTSIQRTDAVTLTVCTKHGMMLQEIMSNLAKPELEILLEQAQAN